MSKTKGCGIASIVDTQTLQSMAAVGMTPAQIAEYYGLTRQGMVKVINNNPELKEAFDKGLPHVLIKAAGVVIHHMEQKNLLAAMYILNNRGGWKEAKYDKEKPDADIPRIQIYLPENFRDSPDNETIIEE